MGKIKLSALLSDGMVLQRETENRIWGYAGGGKMIRLRMGAYRTATETGADGYFELKLPPMKTGGPWTIQLDDGEDSREICDILFGDVFLLGGQSNMEMPIASVMERYGAEIAEAVEKEIRMFDVPKEYAFGEKREEIEKGCWKRACGEDLLLFSAAGFFAAKALYDKIRVPIGLLQAPVGGTPIKAWCSEETIRELGYDAEELAECTQEVYTQEVCTQEKDAQEENIQERSIQESYPQMVERTEAEREKSWWEEALAGKDGRKGSVSVPGFFSGTNLDGFCGALKLRKKVCLTENINWLKNVAKMYLGAVIDADFTCVNGVKVGETDYRYPPRIYEIPSGILHPGENEVEVTMLIFRGEGGFMPGKEYEICYTDSMQTCIPLTGEWEYEILKEMPELPEATFFIYKASGMYQGMLYPLRKWRLKGCLFYQGESNTGRAETYEQEFTAMVADWRALFKQPDLPFVCVQLAGFADGREEAQGTEWARLREAQRCASEHMKNVLMAQAYDLGEYNDLHPSDKKTVGMRIALAAERLIYGRDVVCQGASVKEVKMQNDVVKVTFAPEDTVLHIGVQGMDGIKARSTADEGLGFAWIWADGSRSRAQARLTGSNEVELVVPQEGICMGISYAWNDCPLDANLYNEQNLPVIPFELHFE